MSQDLFERLKGPLGLVVHGSLRPGESSDGRKMRQLVVGEARLVDLGKLDALSPPWMRLGSSAPPGRWQALLMGFAKHLGEKAAKGLPVPGSVCVERVRSSSGLSFPAVCVGINFEADIAQVGLDQVEQASRRWMFDFQSSLGSSLGSKRQGVVRWADEPSRLSFAALKEAFLGSCEDRDAEALALWAPAMLAQEQACGLARSTRVRSSKPHPEGPSIPKRSPRL